MQPELDFEPPPPAPGCTCASSQVPDLPANGCPGYYHPRLALLVVSYANEHRVSIFHPSAWFLPCGNVSVRFMLTVRVSQLVHSHWWKLTRSAADGHLGSF